MPPPCFAVGSRGSSFTSGDVVVTDDGAAVDPTVVTWSPLVLQAAVTATRHSAAMNRAGPRGVRPARRNVGSGVIGGSGGAQSTTPPTIAPLAANTKPKSQAAEPSPAASAPAGTARGTGWHAMGRNKSLNESTSSSRDGHRRNVPAVEIFLAQSCRVVVYQIDISGHELVHCDDTSLLVFGELAAEVVGGPGWRGLSLGGGAASSPEVERLR